MTGIFSETSAKRQELLNQIFDTAIYKELSDAFPRKIEDKYKSFHSTNEALLNEKKAQLIDSAQTKTELESAESSKTNLDNENNILENNIKELVIVIESLKDTKNEIEKISINVQSNGKLLKKENDSKTETEERLKSAQKSLEIVKHNEESYKLYMFKSDESKSISNEIDILEQKEKNKHIFEKSLYSDLNDQTKAVEQISNSELSLKEKQEQDEKLNNDILTLNNDIATESLVLDKIIEELFNISNSKNTFDELYSNYINYVKRLDDHNLIINEKKKTIYDFAEIDSKIMTLENKKEELSLNKELKKEISNKIEALNTRIQDNDDARKILSTGICPYLKQDCQNLKSGSSVEEYFESRNRELNDELDLLNIDIKKFSDLEILNSANENDITLLKKKKEDGLQNDLEVKEIENVIDKISKNIQISELELLKFLNKFSVVIQNEIGNKDFKDVENYLNRQISFLNEQTKILKTKIQGLQDTLNKQNIELNTLNINLPRIIKSIEDIKVFLISLKEKELVFKNSISIIDNEIKLLPDLKQQRLSINQEIEKYKQGYDNYVSNIHASEEIPKHLQGLKTLEISINHILLENISLEKKMIELSDLFSESKLTETKNELEKKKIAEKENSESISELKTIISLKKEALNRNKIIEFEITELYHKIKYLEQKLRLTAIFRDNLKKMGKIVAGRLLSKIEHIATENYRRISGKTEQIIWKIEEGEDYTVYLYNEKHFRKFEQLSGGEQVSVAIALRSAMASILTKANFAIFDEPTNNLDSDRKSALAESLQDLLKNLKQAIIVTHDNSFEEMAQNIINLDKR